MNTTPFMDVNFSFWPNITNNNETAITEHQFSQVEIVIIIVLTGIFSFFTITGNLFIIIAFFRNKKLRTLNNFFLVSLSVADFFVGLLAVPLYTMYILIGNWYGPIACDFWLSLDYGITTTSTFHLLIISLDRYIAVKHPLFHRAHRTSKIVLSVILMTWIFSFLLWIPTIFTISHPKHNLTIPTKECLMPYIYSEDYLVIVLFSALTFWIPVLFMVVFYQRVYAKVLKHKAFLTIHMKKQLSYFVNNNNGLNTKLEFDYNETSKDATLKKCEIHQISICNEGLNIDKLEINQPTDSLSIRANNINNSSQQNEYPTSPRQHIHNIGKETSQSRHSTLPKRYIHNTKEGSEKKNEAKRNNYKAAKTLSAILFAYIITWAPWQIYTVISYFCKDCLPTIFYYFAYYFAYVNSTLNPFLYALCNVTFRTTFLKLISRRKK